MARRPRLADALDELPDVVHVLDHCCANGDLVVSLQQWGAERGITVEPYGVDVARSTCSTTSCRRSAGPS